MKGGREISSSRKVAQMTELPYKRRKGNINYANN